MSDFFDIRQKNKEKEKRKNWILDRTGLNAQNTVFNLGDKQHNY